MLVSCETQVSILFHDLICQYPCWQNIQPGISSSEVTYQILKDSFYLTTPPLMPPIKIDDTRSYDSWTFTKNIQENGARVIYFNDIVGVIEFFENGRMTFGEVVNFYGEPDHVSAISGWGDSRWLNIALIYPSKGVLITHFDRNWGPSDNNAKITSSMAVFEVFYFDPNLYDQLLYSEFFGTADKQIILQSIHPWLGFTNIPLTEQ